MSLRIRESGQVVCAAMHPPEPGDVYVHDGVSYQLTVEHGLLVTEPWELPLGVGLGGHSNHGLWWWRGEEPSGARIERL